VQLTALLTSMYTTLTSASGSTSRMRCSMERMLRKCRALSYSLHSIPHAESTHVPHAEDPCCPYPGGLFASAQVCVRQPSIS
jgi:hypothetical protein